MSRVVCDLGASPLCESFLTADQLNQMEPFYPLRADVCEACWLVQLERYVAPEAIFTEYAYFSSYSDSWVRHARDYTELATERLGLGPGSLVVELASNDGYLLQHFVARGVPVLGHRAGPQRGRGGDRTRRPHPDRVLRRGAGRPAGRARAARPTWWWPTTSWPRCRTSTSFVAGIARLLKPGGVVTVEFPHLARLMDGNQFDTIYHEHFSYFSLRHGQAYLRQARARRCSTSRSCPPMAARYGSGAATPPPRAR